MVQNFAEQARLRWVRLTSFVYKNGPINDGRSIIAGREQSVDLRPTEPGIIRQRFPVCLAVSTSVNPVHGVERKLVGEYFQVA